MEVLAPGGGGLGSAYFVFIEFFFFFFLMGVCIHRLTGLRLTWHFRDCRLKEASAPDNEFLDELKQTHHLFSSRLLCANPNSINPRLSRKLSRLKRAI